MMGFLLPGSVERVVLCKQVLQHMTSYRQSKCWSREAGGQLFARFEPGIMLVERVTGPRRSDKRSRYAYHPDRTAEQREIHQMHALGYHYVGDWHTHPERHPSPSAQDRAAMVDLFTESKTQADGFLLLIQGTGEYPSGLHASWASYAGLVALPGLKSESSFLKPDDQSSGGEPRVYCHPLFD